jgi:formylglycine-generating enzyme required for sulfatase activity
MKKVVFRVALFLLAAGVCHHACADVIFEMTTIGNPGNAPDAPWPDPEVLVGSVPYIYQISTYEVTVAQYVAFLNAVASSDPHGLYRENMSDPGMTGGAIIERYGTEGSYTYAAVAGKENQPVRSVNFYSGLRLANWLHNGQGDGDTETGSYNLSLGAWVTREPGATWVLASQDEWHKAAYYDPDTESYWEYPNGRDSIDYPTDETTPREHNFGGSMIGWQGNVYFTSIGETTGYSAYGVFDMGGNVEEWTDSLVPPGQGLNRVVQGGSFVSHDSYLSRAGAISRDPDIASNARGLRLVLIPEPSTMFLLLLGGPLLFMFKRRQSW